VILPQGLPSTVAPREDPKRAGPIMPLEEASAPGPPRPPFGRDVPGTEAREPRPGSWADAHWWGALAAVLAIALLARLLYLQQVAALPFFDLPVGDSAAHLKRASEIAAGKLLPSHPFYYCSIYYPYFLAAALALFHGSLFWVCVVQVVAGVLVVGLLALTARSLYGSTAGLAAGLLAALYGPFAFFEADILGVVWGQLALACGMLACAWWAEPRERTPRARAIAMVGAGIAFGLAAVERPNLLAIVPAVAGWCALQSAARQRLRSTLALVAGVALPLAAVLGLNVAGTGQWVPLTTSGGINLSLGFHPGATGTYDEPWEREAPDFSARHTEPEEAMIAWASARMGRALTPQEASAYWGGKALEFIREHPAAAAQLTLRKAALLLNAAEIPNHLDFEFIREHAPALWLMPVGFGAILALAAFGIADERRRRGWRAGTILLVLVSGGAMASVLPFTVADRYRAPMVPALVVLAAAGLVALAGVVRRPAARRERGTLVALCASLLAALVSMVPLSKPLRGRDYWMFAQAHEAHGNLRGAIAAYEAAVGEEGDDGELLNNLAAAYRRAGDRDRAMATLRRAVAANPGLSYPHRNLGMLLIVAGERDSALAELRAARRLAPDDAETLGAIGALLAERGERDSAAAAFELARRLAPGDQRLIALVQHYQPVLGTGARGSPATPSAGERRHVVDNRP